MVCCSKHPSKGKEILLPPQYWQYWWLKSQIASNCHFRALNCLVCSLNILNFNHYYWSRKFVLLQSSFVVVESHKTPIFLYSSPWIHDATAPRCHVRAPLPKLRWREPEDGRWKIGRRKIGASLRKRVTLCSSMSVYVYIYIHTYMYYMGIISISFVEYVHVVDVQALLVMDQKPG